MPSASPLYLPSPFHLAATSSTPTPSQPAGQQQQTLTGPRAGPVAAAAMSAEPAGMKQPPAAMPQGTAAVVGAGPAGGAAGDTSAAAAATAAAAAQSAAVTALHQLLAQAPAQPPAVVGPAAGPAVAPMPYIPDERMVRMSLKVFNCTPQQLLPLVRAELERLLHQSPSLVEGYIRPGCVHLTLNLLLGKQQAAALARHGLPLDRLLLDQPADAEAAPLCSNQEPSSNGSGHSNNSSNSCSSRDGSGRDGSSGAARVTWRQLANNGIILQVGPQLAIMRGGRMVEAGGHPALPVLAPRLDALRPLCLLAGQPAPVLLLGSNICGDKDLVLCRQQGRHLATELLISSACPSGSSGGSEAGSPGSNRTCTNLLPALPPARQLRGVASMPAAAGFGSSDSRRQVEPRQLQPGAEQEWLLVKPLGALPGCIDVEVQRGSVLSEALPLLVLPCPAAVAEVRQLEASDAGIGNVACFLRDIGVVAQFLSRHQLAAQGHPTPRYDAALRHCIASMARRLVAAAAARGWSALAALLQPATAACEGKEHQSA